MHERASGWDSNLWLHQGLRPSYMGRYVNLHHHSTPGNMVLRHHNSTKSNYILVSGVSLVSDWTNCSRYAFGELENPYWDLSSITRNCPP